MPFISRRLAAVAVTVVAVAAGAAPAIARTGTAPTATLRARTPLVAKIAADTRFVAEKMRLHSSQTPIELRENGNALGNDAYAVGRVHADSAQRPEQREWIRGVDAQRRGDSTVIRGLREQVYGHRTVGAREIKQGLADFRLGNHDIGQADTRLGVRHPASSAAVEKAHDRLRRPPAVVGAVTRALTRVADTAVQISPTPSRFLSVSSARVA